MSRSGRKLSGLLGLLLFTFVGRAGPCDTIHLKSGGTVRADDWWTEGDILRYRDSGGTVGLPLSLVTGIESAGGDARQPGARATVGPARIPAASASATDSAPARSGALHDAYRALERGEFETAAQLYQRLLGNAEAGFLAPRIGYAVSQIAVGEDALAMGVVLEGLAREHDNPMLLELLGDLRDREERVDDALRAWRAAHEQKPGDRLRSKIARAERELEVGREYEFTPSSHFNLRYDGEVDEALASAVLDHLEQQYWVMAETLRHTPRQPITVVLYPTREFREVTGAPEWVGGLYDGKIRVPLGGLERLDPRAESVLVHELTHAFVHSKTRGQCPRWLHEGLAQRAEGRGLSRVDRLEVARRLREGNAETWESRGFSYAMALSLTSHIENSRGFHAVLAMLDHLGEGQELETALLGIYGDGYGRICREWARAVAAEDLQ